MRKTTRYANKRRHSKDYQVAQHSPQAATILNAFKVSNVMRCSRPFNADDGTDANATDAAKTVIDAFDRIKNGTSDINSTDDFDYLAHAVGVAQVRAVEIAGTDPEHNYILPILTDAKHALERCRARYIKWDKWELDKPAVGQIDYALEAYTTILMSSSPRQMADAVETRLAILKEQAKGVTHERA